MKKTAKKCKKCGATLVITCPIKEEDFCEKKRYYTCIECDHAEVEEGYPESCTYEYNIEHGQEHG